MSHPLILAGFVAVALGGLAFALSSGDTKAQKRQAALQKGSVKAKDNSLEKIRAALVPCCASNDNLIHF